MAAKQFTDAEGRTWDIVTTLGAARRLRAADYDLMSYEAAGDQIPRLYQDELAMSEAIYAIVLPQAQARNVSEEQFLDGMTPEVFDKAREALMAALPDFFSGRKKKAIAATISNINANLEISLRKVLRESPGDESTSGSDASDSTASD